MLVASWIWSHGSLQGVKSAVGSVDEFVCLDRHTGTVDEVSLCTVLQELELTWVDEKSACTLLLSITVVVCVDLSCVLKGICLTMRYEAFGPNLSIRLLWPIQPSMVRRYG